MYRFTLFACLIVAATALTPATPVNRCKDQPFPTEVRVRGCLEPPCIIVKGHDIRFEVDFVAGFNLKNMTTNVNAKMLGLTVNYPLEDEFKYACNMLSYGSYCPLYKGEDVTYVFDFAVGTWYPEIGVNIEISLKDEDDIVTCFNVDIIVVRAP